MYEQIGRYRILDLLGEGSMAEVYKAYDPQIDRELALKILKKEWCLDDSYVERFMREAKAAGAFSHPNIVTVYDIGQIDNRPYIIIELVTGSPLGEVFEPGTPVPMEKVLSIGIQLADALDYAHNHGVVHRDIKPSNIMVLADGETIKIADFGIAHIDDPNAQQTQVGTVLGTPQYMSPEQVMGQKVDGRSDLFSVGVVLYQMCSGQKPFEGDSMATLLYKITRDEPEPLGQSAPGLPAGLQHIIGKLLAKSPERRFQSGDELARALRHEQQVLEELSKDKERHRIIPIRVRWSLVMAGLVALTMAVSVYFIESRQSHSLRQFAVDSGTSLATFIATESAVPVLQQDWITIETFVEEAMERETFVYLAVMDHLGVVRGATHKEWLDQKYSGPEVTELLYEDPDGTMRAGLAQLSSGEEVLDFETPILFTGKQVGKIRLGLSRTPLQSVVDTTRLLLIALALVTVLAVSLVSYVLARLLSRPIKSLCTAMEQIATGNYDCRISEQRNDELGEAYAEFNRMAAALEARDDEETQPRSAA